MTNKLRFLLLCFCLSVLWPVASWAGQAPQVVASVLPVHSLVSAVMKGVGEPALLIKGAVSPHGFALRPSEARALGRADLIVWVGPALERSLVRALASESFAGRQLALLEVPALAVLPIRDEHEHDHGHKHEHKHEDHADHDPHAWLDPDNAVVMVSAIEKALVATDPANAMRYKENAAVVRQSLGALKLELQQALEPLRGQRPGVFHDVLQYFERANGLGESLVINHDPDQPARLAQMGRVSQELKSGQIQCLFAEPQFDGRLVAILVERYGLRQGVLDPLGADIKPGASAYAQLMRQLSGQIRGCMLAPGT